MNFVTSKAGAKRELLFHRPATDEPLKFKARSPARESFFKKFDTSLTYNYFD
jgi:hypothetical protein